jgi:hypothetical protein
VRIMTNKESISLRVLTSRMKVKMISTKNKPTVMRTDDDDPAKF